MESNEFDLWLVWNDNGKLYKRDSIVLKIINDLLSLESIENNNSIRVLSL